MSGRPYHHGDLPAALLARAEQTLREKGAEALSLRELAREVGVSPGAPSRHFSSKQALLDTLALQGFERLADTTADAEANAGNSFAQRLEATARAYVEFAENNAALLELMFSVKHRPEASDALATAVERWSDQLLRLIGDGQQRGEVKAGQRERIAMPIFAALHGYTGLMVSGMLPHEMAADGLADMVAFILRGCAPLEARAVAANG